MDPGQVSRRGERAKEEHKRSGDVPAGDFLPLPVHIPGATVAKTVYFKKNFDFCIFKF